MLKIFDLVFLSIQIDYVQMLSFVVAAEREYLDHVFKKTLSLPWH